MDLKYLQKLIKMLDTSNLAEIEIEEEGTKLKLSKPRPKLTAGYNPVQMPVYSEQHLIHSASQVKIEQAQEIEKKPEPVPSENLVEIKSPMVGTFYRAPSPDADVYVQVGSLVNTGSVVCIIEAMKLMNEIESEVTGKIVKVLVENGHAVEYDQPLFLIEKA